MKVSMEKSFAGVFAFDASGSLMEYRLFSKNPEAIAEKLSEKCAEEKELEKILRAKHAGTEVVMEDGGQRDYRKLALDLKWVKSNQEYNEILSRVNILLTKSKLRVEKRDRILMQAVTTLEEIDKDINVFSEKLREWYGLYFPELPRAVTSNEKLAGIISSHPEREMQDKGLSGLAKKSAGMSFSEKDLEAVRSFSMSISGLFAAKGKVTEYIESEAARELPNLSAVAGPLLACKLVSLAGGLEKMARMPSSTIQLLGSEKALFRHLRGEGKAPKYGVLFGHPHVQQSPKELKGKVARHVAAKLSLAAKVDFFSKEDRGEKLKREMEKEINDILGKK